MDLDCWSWLHQWPLELPMRVSTIGANRAHKGNVDGGNCAHAESKAALDLPRVRCVCKSSATPFAAAMVAICFMETSMEEGYPVCPEILTARTCFSECG